MKIHLYLELVVLISVFFEGKGVFVPIPANDNILLEECHKWTESGYYLDSTNTTVIPAGTCVSLEEFTDGEIITFRNGLDIQGRLLIPEHTKVEIRTKWLVVQGMLSMYSNKKVNGHSDVNFIFFGTDELLFTGAHEINADACDSGGCEFGKKAFVVAGGTMDVKGLPEDCPTWVKLLDYDIGDSVPSTEARSSCSSVIDEDFSGAHSWNAKGGSTYTTEFDSDLGANAFTIDVKGSYNFNGPRLVLAEDEKECLVAGEMYLFSAEIKVIGAGSGPTPCKSSGTDCASFKLKISSNGTEATKLLCSQIGGDYNEWVTCQNSASDPLILTAEEIASGLKLTASVARYEVKLSIANVKLTLLDNTSDTSSDTCRDLVVNGNAISGLTSPFYVNDGLVSVVDEGGKKYFSHTGRTNKMQSIRTDLSDECFTKGDLYRVENEMRIHSDTPMFASILLTSKDNENVEFTTKIGNCPLAGEDSGWVMCEGSIEVTERLENAMEHTLHYTFLSEFDNDESVVDYTNITFAFVRGMIEGIVVDKSVATCWNPGAEILITSHSMDYEDQLVTSIAEIKENPANSDTVILSLPESISSRVSVAEDPGRAVEVALLSRNILVQNGIDADQVERNHGGHFVVMKTPDVVQTIEGIEFRRFGQQGEIGKYPMHFHLCDNVEGSVISKILVRDSNQRCVVVHNTNKLVVKDNVAFDTFGHCYMVEDGGETNNSFLNNLGALTKDVPVDKKVGFEETDDLPATFWISNPDNSYVGNVAAGSASAGFWLELREEVRGPSAEFHPGVNPQTIGLLHFKDNVAHSNLWGFQTFPNGYFPPEGGALISNFHSYLNLKSGMLLKVSKNLDVVGGRFSDNWIGIEIAESDAISVTGVLVQGYSPLYTDIVNSQVDKISLCPGDKKLAGFHFPTYLTTSNWGVKIKDTHFQYLNNRVCTDPVAFDYNIEDHFPFHFGSDEVTEKPYTYMASLENATYDPGCAVVNFCELLDLGIEDAILTDLDSALHENQTGTSALVPDDELVTTFLDNCVPFELSYCARYCPGACMRRISFAVSPYWIGQVKISEDNGWGDTKQVFLNGVIAEGGIINPSAQMFSISLPQGNYTATFIDEQGSISWPVFIEQIYGKEPDCDESESFQDGDVYLSFDTVDESECQDLIKNGDVMGSPEYWHTVDTQELNSIASDDSVQFVNGGFDSPFSSTSNAISGSGVGQYLDQQCLKLMKGKEFQLEASFRLMTDNKPVSCDTSDNGDCPRFFTLSSYHEDGMARQELTDLGPAVEHPYDSNYWSLLRKKLTIPDDINDNSSFFVYVTGGDGVDIWLDKFSMTLVSAVE